MLCFRDLYTLVGELLISSKIEDVSVLMASDESMFFLRQQKFYYYKCLLIFPSAFCVIFDSFIACIYVMSKQEIRANSVKGLQT